jgi:hypothetical protein
MTERELAERIVAENIDRWGWGPLEEIEELSEWKLAVDAAEAGIRAGDAAARLKARRAQEQHP